VIRMRREALLSWKGDVLIPTFPHTTPQDGCWLLVRPIHHTYIAADTPAGPLVLSLISCMKARKLFDGEKEEDSMVPRSDRLMDLIGSDGSYTTDLAR